MQDSVGDLDFVVSVFSLNELVTKLSPPQLQTVYRLVDKVMFYAIAIKITRACVVAPLTNSFD